MPIHLIWGEDHGSSERAIDLLIKKIIDPDWASINLSRLDGQDSSLANQALEEALTPPLGNGGRLILLKKSPFLNGCSIELASKFESIAKQIPEKTHLLLINNNKPDKRLKTTKLIQDLIKSQKAFEHKFELPSIWDITGQQKLVEKIAASLNLEIEKDAINYLIESIGNDSNRIVSELKKLALLEESKLKKDIGINEKIIIKGKSVRELIEGITTNSLEIGNCLLEGNYAKAISRTDSLLDKGEPALKIIATLSSQIRGLLWVSLLESEQQRDVNLIAKQAGIANPKRIYVMRKQIKGKSTKFLIDLFSKILAIEALLKKGAIPKNAFRDCLF